jgi:hypothetical protein
MKNNHLKTYINSAGKATAIMAMCIIMLLAGCGEDEPKKEDVPELITKATLTFTPLGSGDAVVVTATDPDGIGTQDLIVDGTLSLSANKNYTLSIQLVNALVDPQAEEYDITAEVEAEADEHMFFFEWTNNAFSLPAGNGNLDNRNDPVNYLDEDVNGLPLGLKTSWLTNITASSGVFRMVLKHQPELKTTTSGSSVGETDLDISFPLTVQ